MTVRLRPLSRLEVRQLDVRAAEELALPTPLLMENAGRGAAGWLAELVGAMAPAAGGRPFSVAAASQPDDVPHGPALPSVTILCGPGNNGGDGGVVARHLDAWGFSVQVIWFTRSSQLRGDAALQWSILERSSIDQTAWFDESAANPQNDLARLTGILARADWLVDGLLGTGLSRPVEEPLRSVIEAINHSGKPVFALDLPRGSTPTRESLWESLFAPALQRHSWRPSWGLVLLARPILPARSRLLISVCRGV